MSEPLHRQSIYSGKVIDLDIDTVVLPNGVQTQLEIIRHPGGSAVVAINDQGEVCMLRQYRHAAGGWLWELPAGKIDNQEPPLSTAQRELAEEAQLAAEHWESLGEIISSPGVLTERIYLFLARGLRATAGETEPGEVLEVHWLPLANAIRQVYTSEIYDGKTAVGLLRAAPVQGGETWLTETSEG